MWKNLNIENKNDYKRLILAFASLTKAFSQKSDSDEEKISPIINSKFQETVFQHAFNAYAEDIGNTSYDASLCYKDNTGKEHKYLIGIKTFGITSGLQKVAQFKGNHDSWAEIINLIKANAKGKETKEEIDAVNNNLYLELAKKISEIRNTRISSSIANLRGFTVKADEDEPKSVYHVLMPSKRGEDPTIFVGETSYDKIDIDNLKICGCTNVKNPTNFDFTDGNHHYRYTSADSQLHMNFCNTDIVEEQWNVIYVDDAYSIFADIAKKVYGEQEKVRESYSWRITNKDGEVELFSGFNSFFAVGTKMGKEQRERVIDSLAEEFNSTISQADLTKLIECLKKFLLESSPTYKDKQEKIKLRAEIISFVDSLKNEDLSAKILKLLFRPQSELYIPIPKSTEFHRAHPSFFCGNIGTFSATSTGRELLTLTDISARKFNLVFEPSGKVIPSYVCQDSGKAIESVNKQTILGEWILREVFQLKPYEPLTAKKLADLEINGIRLWKDTDSNDIHLSFIWIDDTNPPKDLWA